MKIQQLCLIQCFSHTNSNTSMAIRVNFFCQINHGQALQHRMCHGMATTARISVSEYISSVKHLTESSSTPSHEGIINSCTQLH